MAIYHRATLTPTKAEMVADWIATQPWGPNPGEPVEVIGAYRFDDPNGQVGMETHVATAGGALFHVPVTYRDAPLEGADDSLICEMQHSALGARWVYDGLRDPIFVTMLAAVSMTGQGEAVGMVEIDGRWVVVPSTVSIQGGGRSERVAVDGFEPVAIDAADAVLRNDRFELIVHRRPAAGPRPTIGLTGTWAGQTEPVVLTELHEL
jgi:hypothetical protein